ncbi:SDR family oxidoreductase [Mycobacterium sp.]|uniref:SDR family NAD(P)-dependent oxidoreductase n=1 Tax=Mycobacterium sp. TaxID=1785 RepID=UPI0025D24A68|nr:SDR family oxidoreductase [Mycobacterium sp.]
MEDNDWCTGTPWFTAVSTTASAANGARSKSQLGFVAPIETRLARSLHNLSGSVNQASGRGNKQRMFAPNVSRVAELNLESVMQRLAGKTAVVTGAGSGLGRATAQIFHREGARVVLGDVSGKEKEAAAELGENAVAVSVDVTRPEQVNALLQTAVSKFGGLDILANCAGIDGDLTPAASISDANMQRVVDVNFMGPFYAMRAAVPLLLARGGGSIINVASASTEKAFPMLAAYAASKAALVSLTRSFGAEHAASGIRANVVSPGVIDTPLSRAFPPGMFEAAVEGTPIKRPASPTDIANALLFLASDESAFATAGTFFVDGGMSVA